MSHESEEAAYFFTLQEFADLVRSYGKEQVLHDLKRYMELDLSVVERRCEAARMGGGSLLEPRPSSDGGNL